MEQDMYGQGMQTFKAGKKRGLPVAIGFNLASDKVTILWKITVFDGKTHYKWAIYKSYVSYVKLPEATLVQEGTGGLGVLRTRWK